jgi:hypothetical protein
MEPMAARLGVDRQDLGHVRCIRLYRKRGKTPAAMSRTPTSVQTLATSAGTVSGRGPRNMRRTTDCSGT